MDDIIIKKPSLDGTGVTTLFVITAVSTSKDIQKRFFALIMRHYVYAYERTTAYTVLKVFFINFTFTKSTRLGTNYINKLLISNIQHQTITLFTKIGYK